MEKMPRGYIATALWVAATALMVYGTLDYRRDGTPAGFAWGLFVMGVAATVTVTDFMQRCCRNPEDDVTVEQIAEVVDALHDAKKDVARLIRPRA